MDSRSADKPTRRWIGRGRGVLSLSSQQMNNTEKRPGNLGGGEKAGSVNQNNGSVVLTPASDQRPTSSGEQRLTATANSRPTRTVVERQQPFPAATDQRRQQPPAAATNRVAPQASSSSSNSRLTKPQMQNSTSEPARERVALLAGYSYKANPASPLGFPELNIRQGQKLTLVEKHATNEHWWKVESEDGAVGYVPANYVMVQEKKPSTLPWLQNKQPQEDIPTEKPAWKAYVSAYDKPTPNGNESKEPKKEYYCHICEKMLNGPKPYAAHMVSKAHKEELEVARDMGRDV